MKELEQGLSMYEAVLCNISGSTVNTAISYYGKKYTFDRVFRWIDTLADNLHAEFSIGKGDVVSLCMPNSPAALLMFYALNHLGAIVNLLHPFIPPENLKESIQKTNSKLLLVYDLYRCGRYDFGVPTLVSDSSYFMSVAAKLYYKLTNKPTAIGYIPFEKYLKCRKNEHTSIAKFDENAPAVYLSSGGTTGEPKIIAHSNRTFNVLCSKAAEFLNYSLESYSALYNVLPIFHGFGLCINMHMCMFMRRTNIMCIKFNAKRSARQIVREKAEILTGVPAMYLKLMKEKAFTEADLSNIKDVFVGGDSVSEELIERFNAVLAYGGSSAKMYVGYGLTETVTVCAVNTKAHHRENSIGYPLSGTEIMIARNGKSVLPNEEGEIYLHSDQCMLGYLNDSNPPFVEIDGKTWLKTGDCGHVDEDGFLYFKQRIKNIIKINGVPVFPSEIEAVVSKVEKVSKCCAVEIPDEEKGGAIRLYVEMSLGGIREKCEQGILEACRQSLISYAVPQEVVFMEHLPASMVGKVDRAVLEAQVKEEFNSQN